MSCYMDSSLCIPEEPVLSDGSTSPGILSSDAEDDLEPNPGNSVSWIDEAPSSEYTMFSCFFFVSFVYCILEHLKK